MKATDHHQQQHPRHLLGLLDLPAEVRHQIYRHLFCHKPTPLVLGHEEDAAVKWGAWWSDAETTLEPTFHTGIFRVNKAVGRDALEFAYSANSFRLDKDITTFTRLSPIALESVRALSVFSNAWLGGQGGAQLLWETLSRSCTSLELLVVQPASHTVFEAIPYLQDFVASIPRCQANKPRLLLDCHVWDRHFSFDLPDRDYHGALKELRQYPQAEQQGERRDALPHPTPYECVMRMPRHVRQIQLVLDVSSGALRALDEYIQQSPGLRLAKIDEVPATGGHHVEGRRTRHCYIWKDAA